MLKILNLKTATVALVTLLGTTGCLKDKFVDEGLAGPRISESPRLIEVMGPVASMATYNTAYAVSLDISDRDTTVNVAFIRLASDEPAPEDIQVQLELAPTLLTAYNDTNHTKLVQPPANTYSFANNLVVTIPKGQREAALKMTTKPSAIVSGEFGFGFRVKSVSNAGYGVSGNFNNAVVIIGVKNKYDGIYSVESGRVTRYTAPGAPANDVLSGLVGGNPDVTLVTVNANTVSFTGPGGPVGLQWAKGNNSGVAGIDNLRATVDPVTNLVTMSSLGNATLANWPGKENRYDPATKTFYLAFRWNPSANVREYEVVLKYKGPR